MAIIRHAYSCTVGDTSDTGVVRPSNWNSAHNYTMLDVVVLGGNTAGATASISSGTMMLAGGSNVTLSQNNNSVSIIAGGDSRHYSFWQHPDINIWTTIGAIAQGSLSLQHVYCPYYVSGTRFVLGGSLSAATNTSGTTASCNLSVRIGIYTLNGSTLSLASSGSANNGFQWSQSASTTANTSIQSMRMLTVPLNVNFTPGSYWVGALITSETTYTSAGYTLYGNNLINNAASAAMLVPIGSNTTASSMVIPFQGIYTAATASLPTSVVKSDINWSSASNVVRANHWFAVQGITY